MYIYVYIHICICTYTHTYTYKYTNTCMHISKRSQYIIHYVYKFIYTCKTHTYIYTICVYHTPKILHRKHMQICIHIYVYIYIYAGAAAFRGGAAIAVIGQPRMPELTGPYTTVGVRVVRIPFADTEVGKGEDGGGEEEKGERGQSCRAKIFYPAAAGGGAAETPAAYCTDGRQTSDGVYHDVLKRALYTLKRELRYTQKSPVYTQKSFVVYSKGLVYTQPYFRPAGEKFGLQPE